VSVCTPKARSGRGVDSLRFKKKAAHVELKEKSILNVLTIRRPEQLRLCVYRPEAAFSSFPGLAIAS
jgi:hypothetical protein